MFRRLVLLVAIACLPSSAQAEKIAFHESLELARKAAKAPQPIVLTFGATWCGWCRKLETETLADPRVEAAASQFAFVKIDIDEQKELAARYRVRGVPHVVVLNAEGRPIASQAAFQGPEMFVEFLKNALANPMPWHDGAVDLLDKLKSQQAGPVRRELVIQAVEQLARPDREGRQEILDALKARGPQVWPLLVDLLGDERLAIRAAASQAVDYATKARLPFHPFADLGMRQQQHEAWIAWVSKNMQM